jgi:hypothetical protein
MGELQNHTNCECHAPLSERFRDSVVSWFHKLPKTKYSISSINIHNPVTVNGICRLSQKPWSV